MYLFYLYDEPEEHVTSTRTRDVLLRFVTQVNPGLTEIWRVNMAISDITDFSVNISQANW